MVETLSVCNKLERLRTLKCIELVIKRNLFYQATAAEQLKDDDWVDPSDPTFIAENELLGAAKSIENAAKKLAALKPRTEVKGKVTYLTGTVCYNSDLTFLTLIIFCEFF
jgi:hypothetical protein